MNHGQLLGKKNNHLALVSEDDYPDPIGTDH